VYILCYISDKMSSVDKKTRLRGDPTISVTQITACLEKFLKEQPKGLQKNLYVALRHPNGQNPSFGSRPHIMWMSKTLPLFNLLVEVAPNTIIHSMKLTSAIQGMIDKKAVVNSSHSTDKALCDWASLQVRVLFSYWKHFKLDQEAFQNGGKRLSAEIIEEFVGVLKKINIQKGQQQAQQDAPMPAAVIPPVPNSWSSYLNAFFIYMSIYTYSLYIHIYNCFFLLVSRICRVICIAFL